MMQLTWSNLCFWSAWFHQNHNSFAGHDANKILNKYNRNVFSTWWSVCLVWEPHVDLPTMYACMYVCMYGCVWERELERERERKKGRSGVIVYGRWFRALILMPRLWRWYVRSSYKATSLLPRNARTLAHTHTQTHKHTHAAPNRTVKLRPGPGLDPGSDC